MPQIKQIKQKEELTTKTRRAPRTEGTKEQLEGFVRLSVFVPLWSILFSA